MTAFAAAVFFLIITPGPGVLSAAGVGSGHGFAAGSRYIGGLWLGNLSVGLIVISGLWAFLVTIPGLRETLGILSLVYLFYLAARIAMAGSGVSFGRFARAPGFINGLALQFINPKAYAVNTFLFANFAFMPHSWLLEVLIKLLILNLIWIPIHFAWLKAGVALRSLNLRPSTQRLINIAMAASLVIVVSIAALDTYLAPPQ